MGYKFRHDVLEAFDGISFQMRQEDFDTTVDGLHKLKHFLDQLPSLSEVSKQLHDSRAVTLIWILDRFVKHALWENFGPYTSGFPKEEGKEHIKRMSRSLGRFIGAYIGTVEYVAVVQDTDLRYEAMPFFVEAMSSFTNLIHLCEEKAAQSYPGVWRMLG